MLMWSRLPTNLKSCTSRYDYQSSTLNFGSFHKYVNFFQYDDFWRLTEEELVSVFSQVLGDNMLEPMKVTTVRTCAHSKIRYDIFRRMHGWPADMLGPRRLAPKLWSVFTIKITATPMRSQEVSPRLCPWWWSTLGQLPEITSKRKGSTRLFMTDWTKRRIAWKLIRQHPKTATCSHSDGYSWEWSPATIRNFERENSEVCMGGSSAALRMVDLAMTWWSWSAPSAILRTFAQYM